VNAVASRGGFLKPLLGGVYRVNEEMLDDLESHAWRYHPSNWGAAIANEIAGEYKIDAYVVDPVVVDEMEDVARVSGLPDVKRISIFHASNQKAVARKLAKTLWKRYEQVCVIVAHMGEGTSVGAHCRGRVVDVNNALDGDGPFSALNAGSLPSVDIVNMCFEEGADKEKILHKIRSGSGLLAHLGTANVEEINKMIARGDEKAVKFVDAMGYQVAKEIGGLTAAMEGKVDGIAITGELAACHRLVAYIKSRVGFIARVFVYPGESETAALVSGVLRVMRGEEDAHEYKPNH